MVGLQCKKNGPPNVPRKQVRFSIGIIDFFAYSIFKNIAFFLSDQGVVQIEPNQYPRLPVRIYVTKYDDWCNFVAFFVRFKPWNARKMQRNCTNRRTLLHKSLLVVWDIGLAHFEQLLEPTKKCYVFENRISEKVDNSDRKTNLFSRNVRWTILFALQPNHYW